MGKGLREEDGGRKMAGGRWREEDGGSRGKVAKSLGCSRSRDGS